MDKLSEYARQYDIHLTDRMQEQFSLYADLLLEWNTRMNLTAITRIDEIAVKHFLDSILLLKAMELEPGCSVIDVGTGAGFPGIALKIVRPQIKLTLLDSLKKRTLFLQEVSQALGQDNACIHARAEELARNDAYRERFDVAVARAVAALPVLVEYCLPFVAVGGCFLAMKGPQAADEIVLAQSAVLLLGGTVAHSREYELTGGDRRSIVSIKKISQTSAKYPRSAGKIAKSPLLTSE